MTTFLQGFNVTEALIHMPRIMGPEWLKIRNDEFRKEKMGGIDVGAQDPGFVTMVYGFSVFFLCMAITPPLCLGVWIAIPVVTGSVPWHEARDLLLHYYIPSRYWSRLSPSLPGQSRSARVGPSG
jgi:hypothetical protein